MTARILVADDSLTIQKVIGITLASSGYELIECLNDVDLFRFLQEKDFDLVLLDFNLSDKRTGYELAKQIKTLRPDVSIMIMLGTFDSVDESQLIDCGILDKVVKPFESAKFIKKCKDLVEQNVVVASNEPTIVEDTSADDKLDMWIVDAPVIQHETIAENVIEINHATSQLDPLASELEGWSIDAGLNLEEKYSKAFPAVIEEATEPNALERLQESSGFVSEMEENEEIPQDITQPIFEIPLDLNQQLISEINEEFSPDSFWAVDDIVAIELADTKEIKETHLDEVITKPAHVKKSHHVQKSDALNTDELVEKLKISLRPMIEDLVREYCRQTAEKIAWEVIPDLAENLIRKELKDISESLQ
jgi:DNA-binding response OmpR family regulator